MKWYQKAIYRLANTVLPESVKSQMMGIGRMTVPLNANPWNIFNWLPKKYQTAHNIDLTKLQNYTAEELLEMLVSVHPDVSHALHTYLRIGDTDLSFKAYKTAQKTVDELLNMMNTSLESPGYQHGRHLDKLDGIQRMMVFVRGACAGEVVLNDDCTDVVDIVPVDPALIWFRREPLTNRLIPWQFVRYPEYKPGEEWFGNYKCIDTPTFIYEELDPMVDDPYGRSPILPVLQIVFFHMQVLQDIKAVVHNQGYPRLRVKILEDIMLKNMPAQYRNDPNAQRSWLNDRLNDIQKQFSSLNPDDALIFWDSVQTDMMNGAGAMIDVSKLIGVIDTQIATSLKTLLTLLSRHQGSTETYSNVDLKLYVKTVESARNVTRRFWERAFQLAARVKGMQTNVEVAYKPIDLRTDNELESDRELRITNITIAEDNSYITSEEAAVEVRKTLGLDSKIPTELKQRLKQKHQNPVPAPQPHEPAPPEPTANRRIKLDSTPDNEDDDEENDDQTDNNKQEEQTFIALYLMLMNHAKQNLRHATSVDGLIPSLTINQGVQDRLSRGLWEMYKDVYTRTYNLRADATDSGQYIRNPDTQTSLDFHEQAQSVIDGVVQTYQSDLEGAVKRIMQETSDLPDDQRLKKMQELLSKWMDERATYKSNQIAMHESINAYHEAMFDHDSEHAPHTMYVVVPGSSNHDACIAIISGGPYTLNDARGIILPLHPNCPHHFEAI